MFLGVVLDLTVQSVVHGDETVLDDELDDVSFFFPIVSVTSELCGDQEVVNEEDLWSVLGAVVQLPK